MHIQTEYHDLVPPHFGVAKKLTVEVEDEYVVISQLHSMGACSSLMIYNLSPGHAIKPALEYCIKEQVLVPCNTVPNSQKKYPFTSYAFVTASTSSDQKKAEKVLKELGFINTNKVRKKKNPQNLVRFWMIDMPTLVKNLGYNPADYGLELLK